MRAASGKLERFVLHEGLGFLNHLAGILENMSVSHIDFIDGQLMDMYF